MSKQTNSATEQSQSVPQLRFPEFLENWEKHNLGEIASFSKGKGISKADIVEDGATECIRYGELYTTYGETIDEVKSRTNIDENNLVFSEGNDVIIPASGETQIDIATASCVLRDGIALGGDLNIIKTQNNGVFLSYYLNYKKKQEIASLAQGISVVHLYSSQLSLLELNLPLRAEQDKIALFIRSTAEKIQTLKKKHRLLEQYKKGVMQKLFSQELRFKDENGEEFAEWEVKKLGEVFYSDKGKGISKNKIVAVGKYECVLYGELYTRYNEVIFDVVSKTNEEGGTKSKIGDLLIPSSTTTTGIDLANVTALNKNDVLLGGDITILRSNEEINNVFYAYYLSNYKKQEIASYAQGITIVHLYYNHIKEMVIDLPSYEEQTLIANFLSALDEKINHTTTQIEKMEVWKKGLLQKMFV
jgi:type I restriction enzyme, S subunit